MVQKGLFWYAEKNGWLTGTAGRNMYFSVMMQQIVCSKNQSRGFNFTINKRDLYQGSNGMDPKFYRHMKWVGKEGLKRQKETSKRFSVFQPIQQRMWSLMLETYGKMA